MTTKLTVKTTALTKDAAFKQLREALDEAELKGVGMTRFEFHSVSGAIVNFRTLRTSKPRLEMALGSAVGAAIANDAPFARSAIEQATSDLGRDIQRRANLGIPTIATMALTDEEWDELYPEKLWPDDPNAKLGLRIDDPLEPSNPRKDETEELFDDNSPCSSESREAANIAAQADCSARHWAFRKWAEGTSFMTPDRKGAAKYMQEEMGEVARVSSMIDRPEDARRNRQDYTDHDLNSELADLWLMLDTAQQQQRPFNHFPTRRSDDPLTDIQVAVNQAINLCLVCDNNEIVVESLEMAKRTICKYPGFNLSVYVSFRLDEWKGRVK